MIERRIVVSRWQSKGDAEIDLFDLHSRLIALTATDPEQCVLVTPDRTTAVLPASYSKGDPLRLQLLALRDENARSIQFRPGSPLARVQVLEGHMTGEVTHVCLWDDGIAAQDWFTDVPRLSRLSEFLRRKLQTYIHFDPYYEPSLWDALQDVRTQLRSVTLSLHRDSLPQVEDTGVFESLLREAIDPRVPVVDLGLKMGRHSPRDAYLPEIIDEEIAHATEVAPELLENLVVTGRSRTTGKMRTINLHKSRIEQPASLEPSVTDSQRPDETDAYRKIVRTVNDLRGSERIHGGVSAAVHLPKSS